ncbi:MAG: hypothetical protein ABFS46_19760 [Myxococcota bacterium]
MANATRPLRDPVVERYLPDVDRSLIRRNLTLSVEERFLQLMELQRFAEELKRGGAKASRG